ncbi:MAG: 4Fe-4S dicluster domain-containing protein [Lachnospiraceae bacterium]|nr:4Fe-4S dicluster domain-containing protein [Lachnospiraceae bacterium]
MNYFVKGNPDLCIGCRTCMIGCVVAHEGKHIFEVDPDSYTFAPRLHMVKTARLSVPVQCKQCENPACMAACAAGAIYQEDHRVLIREEKCIGCKACMDACPFGAIDLKIVTGMTQADGSEKKTANKCDVCHNIPGGPACVRVCPTQALRLVTEEELNDDAQKKRMEAARKASLALSAQNQDENRKV